MSYTYILGYVELRGGNVVFDNNTFNTPDESLVKLIEILCTKINANKDEFKSVNLISPRLDKITVNHKQDTEVIYNVEFTKHYLEDFQAIVYKKNVNRGYIYNSSSNYEKEYVFFFKQISNIQDSSQSNHFCTETYMFQELKERVKNSGLKKIGIVERNNIFESDFKIELQKAIDKKTI